MSAALIKKMEEAIASDSLTNEQKERIKNRIARIKEFPVVRSQHSHAIQSSMARGPLSSQFGLVIEVIEITLKTFQKRDGSGEVIVTTVSGFITLPFNNLAHVLKNSTSAKLADDYTTMVFTHPHPVVRARPFLVKQAKRVWVDVFDAVPDIKKGDFVAISNVRLDAGHYKNKQGTLSAYAKLKGGKVTAWTDAPTTLQICDMFRKMYGGENVILRPIDSKFLPSIEELEAEVGASYTTSAVSSESSSSTDTDAQKIAEEEERKSQSRDVMKQTLKKVLPDYIPEDHPMREYILGHRNVVHVLERTSVTDIDGSFCDKDVVSMEAPVWNPEVTVAMTDRTKLKNPNYHLPERLVLHFTQQGVIYGEDATQRMAIDGTIFHVKAVATFGMGWPSHAKLLLPKMLSSPSGVVVRGIISAEDTLRMGLTSRYPVYEGTVRVRGLSLSCFDVFADMPRILRTTAFEITSACAVRIINNWLSSLGVKVANSMSANCSKLAQLKTPAVKTMLEQNTLCEKSDHLLGNCFESTMSHEAGDTSIRYFALTTDEFGGNLRERINAATDTFYYNEKATDAEQEEAREKLDTYRELCSDAFTAADGHRPLPEGVEMTRGENHALVVYMIHSDLDARSTTTCDINALVPPLSGLASVPSAAQVLADYYGTQESATEAAVTTSSSSKEEVAEDTTSSSSSSSKEEKDHAAEEEQMDVTDDSTAQDGEMDTVQEESQDQEQKKKTKAVAGSARRPTSKKRRAGTKPTFFSAEKRLRD